MSLLKQKSEVIDGYTIKGTQLPAIQAFNIKTRIMKMIAPALSNIKDDKKESNGKKEINELLFINAIGEFAQNIEPEQFINLVMNLLHGVYISGNDIQKEMHLGDNDIFNMCMAGKMVLLYKIIFFVIKLNYEDFFLLMTKNIGSLGSGFQRMNS